MVWGEHFFFELERGAVVEGAVAAVGFLEGLDVVEDLEAGGGAGGRHLAGQVLRLARGDGAFGQGIVLGIARAAHAAGDAPGGGELRESIRGWRNWQRASRSKRRRWRR